MDKDKIRINMYERIKDDILGKKYSLSIAFISAKKSRELNKKYRKKNKATNVLSFALHKNEGEILLSPSVIRKEARMFNKTYKQFLEFLVIHGMLHLKGMTHSSTMDKAQNFYFAKYQGKYYEKYLYRHRHRVANDQNRSGRVRQRRKKS